MPGRASTEQRIDGSLLAEEAEFSLIGEALGRDVSAAVRVALASGAVFPNGRDPLAVFRATVADSIRDIETHPRGRLFREFLMKGPYVDSGPIPRRLRGEHLSDDDVARVIAFVYSFMVNSFKGAVAELLAAGAVARLVKRMKQEGRLRSGARVFVGDAVFVRESKGTGWRKGADIHVLEEETGKGERRMRVASVAEVKSYFRSEQRLREQIDQHIRRARRGIRVSKDKWPARKVMVGIGSSSRVMRITVEPDEWLLPRSFRFRKHAEGRRLYVEPSVPRSAKDEVLRKPGSDEWHIVLRWSKEALAEAAYEMTFWYMGKIGESLYSKPNSLPKGWDGMTAAEAGRNAAKMMLYYAILRARTIRQNQRAIALYNSYGFGYALGMNFFNKAGRREMLWPQDLDEIAESGCNKDGCRIV